MKSISENADQNPDPAVSHFNQMPGGKVSALDMIEKNMGTAGDQVVPGTDDRRNPGKEGVESFQVRSADGAVDDTVYAGFRKLLKL